MVGRKGLWKRFASPLVRLWSFSRILPPSFTHPPWYFSWSPQREGYPVPGFVSTLFHHMYSVPRRSVHRFLQAMLQVWQPMHLSRWNTIETFARMFTGFLPHPLPSWFSLELVDVNISVPVGARRAPGVECVAELGVAARHEDRFQARLGQAVVPPGPPMVSQGGPGDGNGAFRSVVVDSGSPRHPRANHRPRDDDSVVVVRFDPGVIGHPDLRGV